MNTVYIDLLWQEHTPVSYLEIARNAINAILSRLNLANHIQLRDVGTGQAPLNGRQPRIVEGIMAEAQQASHKAGHRSCLLEMNTVLNGLMTRWEMAPDHLPFLITRQDLIEVDQAGKKHPVFGCSRPRASAVSLFRFSKHKGNSRQCAELFTIEVMREFGHLLGAPHLPSRDEGHQLAGNCYGDGCLLRALDDLHFAKRALLPHFRSGLLFCERCENDIRANVVRGLQL